MATTITVEPDTLEEFNEMKQRYATDGRASADGFVNHLMDVYERAHNNRPKKNTDDKHEEIGGHDAEQMREILELMERIKSGVSTVEDRTGTLPNDVADELEARLR